MVICRRRAAGIAFLEPGSNSATPGGGHNAYKADARKPKGLIRSDSSYSSYSRFTAFRRVIVSTIADRRY